MWTGWFPYPQGRLNVHLFASIFELPNGYLRLPDSIPPRRGSTYRTHYTLASLYPILKWLYLRCGRQHEGTHVNHVCRVSYVSQGILLIKLILARVYQFFDLVKQCGPAAIPYFCIPLIYCLGPFLNGVLVHCTQWELDQWHNRTSREVEEL